MKPILRVVGAAALWLAGAYLAVAQAPAPPATPEPMADATRISVEECKQALAKKAAIPVDVRGDDAYRAGHIAGAISLPGGGDLKSRAEELKQSGKTIVTYCS